MCIFYSAINARPLTLIFGLISLALCGYLNGFMCARTLKFFQIHEWKTAAIISALIFPCYILITLSLGDIIESAKGSSAARPISEGLGHYLAWWIIDGPCAAYGAYKGFSTPLGLEPEVGRIQRTIPDIPWYLRRPAIMCIYGFLIFATIFFEF